MQPKETVSEIFSKIQCVSSKCLRKVNFIIVSQGLETPIV